MVKTTLKSFNNNCPYYLSKVSEFVSQCRKNTENNFYLNILSVSQAWGRKPKIGPSLRSNLLEKIKTRNDNSGNDNAIIMIMIMVILKLIK